MDAIDEISVNITPFDIRQSGFIGSAINAVTRAGTNTFSGSVYNYFRTEKQRGDQVEASKFIRPIEEYKQYGFRMGGPIVKNKLFFFMNYETENQPKSIQNFLLLQPLLIRQCSQYCPPYCGFAELHQPILIRSLWLCNRSLPRLRTQH